MTRWRLVLEYDGGGFGGYQLQPGQRTVQGELEAALERFLGEAVRVSVSGRTDTGVHAEGQVVSFVTGARRDARAVRDGLNALLPADVAVVEAAEAPLDFDPRHWARTKRYRYRWLDRPARSPLRANRAWHLRSPLDVDAMHRAAQACVGLHDFSSFRANGCQSKHPNRILVAVSVRRVGDEVHLEAEGHGFLRHMIRILAGTLAEIGLGKRPEAWLAEVLEARDRTRAGQTAPAHGLTLVSVTYFDAMPDRRPLDGEE